MKNSIVILALLTLLGACKNNGSNTASSAKASTKEKVESTVKQITVDPNRKPSKPDFQVLEMSNENDVLTVIFRYSGGCKEHDFNAYFSGGWLKSLPPQAIIDFEHLNPDNDACRSLVKDTAQFDLTPLRYGTSGSVVVKWPQEKGIETTYEYGK